MCHFILLFSHSDPSVVGTRVRRQGRESSALYGGWRLQSALWAELCHVLKHRVLLTPNTSEYDYIWDKVFKEIIKLKWGHWGWSLSQYDWCPYKKKKSGHRHTWREDHVKTRWEDGHLQAKQGGLRRNQPFWGRAHISSLQDCKKMNFCCVSHSVWYFVMAALGN